MGYSDRCDITVLIGKILESAVRNNDNNEIVFKTSTGEE